MTMDRLRRPIAVVVSRFPLITETFILRELIELEQRGQPVVLVPLIRERATIAHREARGWIERAHYTPYLSWPIVRANLRALAERPLRYVGLLGRLIAGSLGSPSMLLKTLALWPKFVYLSEHLAQMGITHVHAHFATHPATAALVASRLGGASYSITVHAHDIFVDRTMLDLKVRHAAFVRCISEFNRSFLLDRIRGLDAAKTAVIHVGVPLSIPEVAEPAVNLREPVILSVAALKPYKGVQFLLDACRILKDRHAAFRCHVVGDGPLWTRLEAHARRLGLADRVVFEGALPQDAVAQRMRDAAVFVHPSVVAPTGQMDGIPVALMEAMAAGRPVIASNLSGVPELIDDGRSGLLVPPGDATGLADAISLVLGDTALAATLAAAGRHAVRREFDLGENVLRLIERIEQFNSDVAIGPGAASMLDAIGAERLRVGRILRRTDSELIELSHDGPRGMRQFVLKQHGGQYHNGRGPIDRALREFAVLSRLEAVQRDRAEWEGFGAPRPVAFSRDAAAILMTRCEGHPLDALIRNARTGNAEAIARATDALRRAGGWVRLFQETDSMAGPDAVRPLLARAASDLELCIERRALPHHARACLRRLEAMASAIPTSARQPVATHGDFWPGNILVGDDLFVVDFEAVDSGPRYQDAGYFLIHLQLYWQWPGAGRQYAQFAQAFLDGFTGGAAIDPGALDVCRVTAALQALANSTGDQSRLRSTMRRRLFRSIVLHAGVQSPPRHTWQLAAGEAR